MLETILVSNGLSLERLRNFCLIADAGSLTKAAQGDASRMALFSRQIKELETFFGVELRRRQGKGIVLTESGRRLAALAREQLSGLEDFRRSCAQLPVEVTIASANSILEWRLIPRVGELRKNLPSARFRLLGLRTSNIVEGLVEQSLDFGIIRSDALRTELRCQKLKPVAYKLFVPRKLAPRLTASNLRERICGIPIATSAGGQFRERLESDAEKARWQLDIQLHCSSVTQAARAVEAGSFAGILPDVATSQFDPGKVTAYDLPFLKGYVRPMVLAWNLRAMSVRTILEPVRGQLVNALEEGDARRHV